MRRNMLVVAAVFAGSTLTLATANASPPPNGDVTLKQFTNGQGSRVIAFSVTRSGPVELILVGGGTGNFIVKIISPDGSQHLLVNAIGQYSGATILPYATQGRYRLAVTATGLWVGGIYSLIVPQPGYENKIPGLTSAHTDFVQPLQASVPIAPTVTASCQCKGNFIVTLHDYRGGSELLFNEIGAYSGQTVSQKLNAGHYLLEVKADGPWKVRFTR